MRLWAIAAAMVVGSVAVGAERMPVRTYTVADGLAHDRINRIFRDSHGFLWFCAAAGGLSRFDGSQFVTYGPADGLSIHTLNDIIEDPDGTYWIGTNGSGVYHFDPRRQHGAARRFTSFAVGTEPASSRVNVLFRDRAGRLWAGTDGGLFILDSTHLPATFHPVPLGLSSQSDRIVQVWAFLEDQSGTLWIGTSQGLVLRHADAASAWYSIRPDQGVDHVWSLMEDRHHSIWIGSAAGLIAVQAAARRTGIQAPALRQESIATLGNAQWHTVAGQRRRRGETALFQTSDGHLWVGTYGALTEFDGSHFRSYGKEAGLSPMLMRTFAEDSDGNLWVGTESGAIRLARHGLTSFAEADGLRTPTVAAIFESRTHELCAISLGQFINVFDGTRFHAIRPRLPQPVGTDYAIALQDRIGEWWVPLGDRLYRFPNVQRIEQLESVDAKAVYTTRDGLPGGVIWRLFEDSRGDVWIAAHASAHEGLTRWDRATETFHRYSDKDGLPSFNAAHSFAEDRAGGVWIGFWEGGIARYREGRFTRLAENQPKLWSAAVPYADHHGRVWVCSGLDLARIEDPAADPPRLVRVSVAGLDGACATLVGEDAQGRLYITTPQGLRRLDPATGHVTRYATADGLAVLEPSVAFRDREGAIWFGTSQGLSRLQPEPDRPRPPPTVAIGGVRAGGVAQDISALGESAVAGLELRPDRRQLEVDYFALSFGAGDVVRYQYKLERVDRDWSVPTDRRTISYAGLAPGRYRFLVRAVNPDSAIATTPASLAFTVLAPVWQRWWFLSMAGALAALLFYAGSRYHVQRLLELERIRTRIATDLHDDIGASLSQIAILSEVARRRTETSGAPPTDSLNRIAVVSRELVDSMSDIVWAVDPDKDRIASLTARMRRLASEALASRDIEVRFEVTGEEQDRRVGADLRRQVLLILKESLNNVLRHSHAAAVAIDLHIEGDRLVLTIRDDGCGFDPARSSDGRGLSSLRERAQRLGGALDIQSTAGAGTTVTLVAPLGASHLNRWVTRSSV